MKRLAMRGFRGAIAVLCLAPYFALPSSAAAAANTTFFYTGGEQSYTVPTGVSAVTITAVSARGGRAAVGSGATVTAPPLAVYPQNVHDSGRRWR